MNVYSCCCCLSFPSLFDSVNFIDVVVRYVKAYRKISRIINMMAWFGLKEWKFAHRNIDELNELLPIGEREKLQFNIATINWSEYFRSYLSGIRRYFFKDNANDNKLQQRKTIYRR